ncbi:MAG: ferric iron uptake transcriptional regulator [Pseudomonadota bacterium]
MDISKELRDSGLKATLPRVRILQLFQEGKSKHLNAEEIYHLLHGERINVGLATIYRVLMQLAEAGILIRRQFESAMAVFELNRGGHHDHLICTNCGKMEEFCDTDLEQRQIEVARELGFDLREHSLSLYGICADCADGVSVRQKKIRRL